MRLLNKLFLEANSDFDVYSHLILLGYRGSIAHDLYIPGKDSIDDKDLMGVLIPPVQYYFGLKQFGRYGNGTKELVKDCWDVVIYEFKKYISLMVKNNPNVLSLLWLPDDLYIKKTEEGNLLIKYRDFFSSKLVYKSFCGYAHGQLKKMTAFNKNGYMGQKRKELVDKFGFDVKNSSHLIRLLTMGCEFLETGQLQVKRTKDKSKLLEIKRGVWSLDRVKAEADKLFKRIKYAYENTGLPDEPDYEKIENLCIEILLRKLS